MSNTTNETPVNPIVRVTAERTVDSAGLLTFFLPRECWRCGHPIGVPVREGEVMEPSRTILCRDCTEE